MSVIDSIVLLIAFFLWSGNAVAQSVDKEPVAIVELGGAAGWNFKDGGSSFGPDFAVEVTPIENWLELEAGTTPLFGRHSTEWDTDLLFKKPWTFEKSGIYGRAWSGVEGVRRDDKLTRRRSCAGFHVLARCSA